jgi:hypothetical protein
MPRHKRHPGGQPGNQNARKHGFYSTILTPRQALQFWNIVNTEGIAPESLALRLKIANALQNAPGNTRVLTEIARLLSKFMLSRQPMTKPEYTASKKFFRDTIKAIGACGGKNAEQIIAESLKRLE